MKFVWKSGSMQLIIGTLIFVLIIVAVAYLNSKKIISETKRILVIGQDNDSIADYVSALGTNESVGGVSAYVDLQLNGLSSDDFNGSGNNNIQRLSQAFPNAVLVVAVKAQDKLDEIIRGDFDSNIDVLLRTLLSYNRQIYLRFGYEFDGPWNQFDPQKYVVAWKRLAQRLENLNGRGKIALVWHSSSQCHLGRIRTYKNYPLSAWYPGDDFVDLIAVSYFTPGGLSDRDVRGGTCEAPNIAIDAVARFAHRQNKPLMIAEATPQGYSIKDLTWRHRYGGEQAGLFAVSEDEIIKWFDLFFSWIKANDVKIVTYINTDWNSQAMYSLPNTSDYWGSSRIQDNSKIRAMWLKRIKAENFN
jgi:hypothetical protein